MVSKYNWVGNKIDEIDMCYLYLLKNKLHKPITHLVSEAVSEYVARKVEEYPEIEEKIFNLEEKGV